MRRRLLQRILTAATAAIIAASTVLTATAPPATAATYVTAWKYGEGTPGGCAIGGTRCVRQYQTGQTWGIDTPDHLTSLVWRGFGDLQMLRKSDQHLYWHTNTTGAVTIRFYASCRIGIYNSAGVEMWTSHSFGWNLTSGVSNGLGSACSINGLNANQFSPMRFDRYGRNWYATPGYSTAWWDLGAAAQPPVGNADWTYS